MGFFVLCPLHLATHALRLTIVDLHYVPCEVLYALRFTPYDLRYAMLYALRKWRRIGWKNVCKLWLQERTPEQLKGEGVHFGGMG